MNAETLSHKWDELTDDIKKQWNKFSDEELEDIGGYKDKFLNALQQKYGYAKGVAEDEFEKFMSKHDIDWEHIKDKAANVVKEFPQEFGHFIQSNPYKAVLVALGTGFLLGSLVLR